jgi:integrase
MSVHKLPDGRWIVVYYVKTSKGKFKPKRQYFGRGKEEEAKARARDQVIKAKRVAVNIVESGVTFNRLALAYQNAKMVPVGGMSKSDQIATYYKLQKFILPFFRSKKALSLNIDLCQKYVETRLAAGVKSVTVRREIQIIKAILNWSCAPGRGLIPYNPIANFPLPEKDDATIPPLTEEELKRIYDVAPPHVKRFVLLNINTGARSGAEELLKILWEMVDVQGKVITVISAKRRGEPSYRRIPFTEEFLSTLTEWRAEDARLQGVEIYEVSGPIVNYKGRPIKRIKTAWAGALRRANIQRRVRPYDLRHYFATKMAEEAGMGIKNLSELLANTVETTYKYYLHGATKEKRKGVESIGAVVKSLKEERPAD